MEFVVSIEKFRPAVLHVRVNSRVDAGSR
jgi:hypothetical protein